MVHIKVSSDQGILEIEGILYWLGKVMEYQGN